jgi:hypothetical protein
MLGKTGSIRLARNKEDGEVNSLLQLQGEDGLKPAPTGDAGENAGESDLESALGGA